MRLPADLVASAVITVGFFLVVAGWNTGSVVGACWICYFAGRSAGYRAAREDDRLTKRKLESEGLR